MCSNSFPERKSSLAGNPIKTKHLEDDRIVGRQLAPQLGKETQVLCMTRPCNNPGKFTMEFEIVDANLGKISVWLRAPVDVQCVFIVHSLCILIMSSLPAWTSLMQDAYLSFATLSRTSDHMQTNRVRVTMGLKVSDQCSG